MRSAFDPFFPAAVELSLPAAKPIYVSLPFGSLQRPMFVPFDSLSGKRPWPNLRFLAELMG